MKTDLQAQEQYAQEQIRLSPPFENAYTIEVDRLRAENAKLKTALVMAIKRIEIANSEGDPILSAWIPVAKKLLGGKP